MSWAIEEEDLLGLGGNADSMIISSITKRIETFADRAGSLITSLPIKPCMRPR
jgi:hypothetical protein